MARSLLGFPPAGSSSAVIGAKAGLQTVNLLRRFLNYVAWLLTPPRRRLSMPQRAPGFSAARTAGVPGSFAEEALLRAWPSILQIRPCCMPEHREASGRLWTPAEPGSRSV